MVKSSIVVPPQATGGISRKRLPQDSQGAEIPAEPKRPRLQLNTDGNQRNQRLFGVLLGTLNKFKDDSENKSDAEKKRLAIESKLQEKLANEKKEIGEEIQAEREQKQQAIEARKRQAQRALEEKRESVVLRQHKNQAHFLMTKTSPSLCYLPATLTEKDIAILEKQSNLAKVAQEEFEGRQQARTQDDIKDSTLVQKDTSEVPSPSVAPSEAIDE
ncbi:pinin/SDK/memA/ protein conserved region-domain-containing protein [Phycomyces blakesleeanus]|uniref:Pinin/SDK/memA/ protein conserved region-domain-containing protein n=1 Tax=Phycomyces blakesleeanus TaxID=4837 RepID=A0ABR3APA4_PHYBL